MIVLYVDESHLTWGDACGYVWGPSNQRIDVPIVNKRERQTYYGAIDAVTGEKVVTPLPYANSSCTQAFLELLRRSFEGKRLIICWDNASYHRSADIQRYLASVNQDYEPTAWPITCISFAPYAPDQNPIEAIWHQAKAYVRSNWHRCQNTFQSVIELFEEAINAISPNSAQLQMYLPALQIN